MGMYDYVKIDKELLPLTDEQKAKIPDNPGWQTKDIQHRYDGGQLDTFYLSKDSIKVGIFVEDGMPIKDFEFTGDIMFYTDIGVYGSPEYEWMEFLATYKRSKFIEIERINHE